jgi:predicted amidohydrolase
MAPGQAGSYDGVHWCYGRSVIVDPWGTVLATAPDAETTIEATLDRTRIAKVRRQVPSLANRMPDRYLWPEPQAAVVS